MSHIISNKIAKSILPIGVLLSIIQFFFNRSLWMDEAFIGNNLINRNFLQLLEPLDDNQVAPILYLYLQKMFVVVFNYAELAFKILPLIFFISSSILFYKVITSYFSNYLVQIFAFSIFSSNYVLIYYSSEVKQYLVDVFVTLLIYYFTIKSLKSSKHQLLCIVGVITIFLSNISIIVLFCSWLFLFYHYVLTCMIKIKKLVIIALVWALFFGIYFFAFIHNHPTRDFMQDYWLRAGAFMPYSPFDGLVYNFLWQKTDMIFGGLLSNIYWIGFVLSLIAFISFLIKKKIKLIILLVLPIILHLILSAIQLYPFSSQVTIYLIPLIIILISFGFNIMLAFIPKLNNPKFAIIIPLILFVQFFSQKFPFEREEIKDSYNYVKNNISQKDKIYVYYGAVPAYNFYSNINVFNLTNDIIIGKNCRANIEMYKNDLLNLEGNIWLIFSHDRDYEKAFILNHMIDSNFLILQHKVFSGSEVFLFSNL